MRKGIVVGCLALGCEAVQSGVSSPTGDRTPTKLVASSEPWPNPMTTSRPMDPDAVLLRAQARQVAGEGNSIIDNQQQAVVAALSSASITFSARLAYVSSSASSVMSELQTSLEAAQVSASGAIAAVQASASSAVASASAGAGAGATGAAGQATVAAAAAAEATMTEAVTNAQQDGSFGACSPPEVALAVVGIIMGVVGLLALTAGLFLFFRARSIRQKLGPSESEVDMAAAGGGGNWRSNRTSHDSERRDGLGGGGPRSMAGSVKDKRRRWQVHGASLSGNTNSMLPLPTTTTAKTVKMGGAGDQASRDSNDVSLAEYQLPAYTRLFLETSPTKATTMDFGGETSEASAATTTTATSATATDSTTNKNQGTADMSTPLTAGPQSRINSLLSMTSRQARTEAAPDALAPVDARDMTPPVAHSDDRVVSRRAPSTAATRRATTVFRPAGPAAVSEPPRPTSSVYEPLDKASRVALAGAGGKRNTTASMAPTTTRTVAGAGAGAASSSPTSSTASSTKPHRKSHIGVVRRPERNVFREDSEDSEDSDDSDDSDDGDDESSTKSSSEDVSPIDICRISRTEDGAGAGTARQSPTHSRTPSGRPRGIHRGPKMEYFNASLLQQPLAANPPARAEEEEAAMAVAGAADHAEPPPSPVEEESMSRRRSSLAGVTSHRLTSPGGSGDSLVREYHAFVSRMGADAGGAQESETVSTEAKTVSAASVARVPPTETKDNGAVAGTEDVGVAVSTPTNVAVRSPKSTATSPTTAAATPASTAAPAVLLSPTPRTPRWAPPAGPLPGLPLDGLPRRTKTIPGKGNTPV